MNDKKTETEKEDGHYTRMETLQLMVFGVHFQQNQRNQKSNAILSPVPKCHARENNTDKHVYRTMFL